MTCLLNHGQGDAVFKGQQISSNLADQLMQLGDATSVPKACSTWGMRQLKLALRSDSCRLKTDELVPAKIPGEA